jgi:hypothetical protein
MWLLMASYFAASGMQLPLVTPLMIFLACGAWKMGAK